MSLRWVDPPEKSSLAKPPVTAVDIEGQSVETEAQPSDTVAWRDEMSKRFDLDADAAGQALEQEREVFERKLENLEHRGEPESEWEQESGAPLPSGSSDPGLHPLPPRPEQRRLSLDPPPSDFEAPSYEDEQPEEEFSSIPREVIISRILAGLVDLLIPVVLGLLFVFSATWFAGLEFFSAVATRWWVIFSVVLFVHSSIFFLWSSGQTPGMYLTELRVIDSRNREPGMFTTMTRVLLFLVSLVTVVGLLLAVFDPQCRALHDRLTGTKVVPEAGLPD